VKTNLVIILVLTHESGGSRFLQNTDNHLQGGSNMTGTDTCVNKPHYAAAVRP